MKALVGAFNQEKALVGAFSVIVKTGCGTDGSICGTSLLPTLIMFPVQELAHLWCTAAATRINNTSNQGSVPTATACSWNRTFTKYEV